MKSHNYKFGRRINWRSILLAMVFPICFTVSHYANLDNTYVREPDVFMKPVVVVPEPTLEDKIREYFPRSWKTMIPIAYAESGMRMNAVGYNCYYSRTVYYNEDVKNVLGQVVHKKGEVKIPSKVHEIKVKGDESKACKKEHRKLAWSVDCFALQKNYPGRKTCPEGVTVDMHLKEVAELSKIQGLKAWSSYNQGKHLAYVNK